MKIESISSILPNWYDPNAPHFKKPKDWKGCRVRISIPVSVNPSKELADARVRLQSRYPGAILHLVPEYSKTTGPAQSISITGSDEDLLRSYFSTVTLPAHVTVDQIISYITKFIPSISVFGSKGLQFKSVVAENVLCFEHCEVNLDLTGLSIVTGLNKDWNDHSNGSGKSSYTSLPFIGLFGRTFKNQTHDEWASQFNDKTAKITSTLILSDGRTLEIIRQRRPGSLRAFVDGTEVTMGRAEATQALIERLTNLTWEVLTNALYIGQSEIGSVFGTEKDRKELFSRLLGLERFLDAQAKLSKIALRIKRSADFLDIDISMADARIRENTLGLENLTGVFENTPKVSTQKISGIETALDEVRKTIEANEKILFSLALSREGFSKEIQRWIEKESEAQTRMTVTQETLDSTYSAQDRCHVCGNTINPTALKAYQTELINTIKIEKEKSEKYERIGSKILKKIKLARSEEQAISSNIKELHKIESSLMSSLEDLRSKISDQNRLETMIEEKQARIKSLEKTKRIHEQAKQFTLEEKQFLDICVSAVSRNGLPAYLCETTIPQLNQTAQHYSEVYADGEIGIQFSASNGDVDVAVCNLHGGKLTKDQSAGEMRMAAIITAFTFRDCLLPLNLLIVDEPSEGLDPANSLAFAKGLTQVFDRFHHVMVISHNTNLLSALEPDRRVEIVKENRVSTASIINT